jgi:toxin CcdB
MAQFDAYQNGSGFREDAVPFLLNIQSDLLESSKSRVIIPLRLPHTAGTLVRRLNPVFQVGGTKVALMTQEITSLPTSVFGPRVEAMIDRRDDIMAAIDLLISGY